MAVVAFRRFPICAWLRTPTARSRSDDGAEQRWRIVFAPEMRAAIEKSTNLGLCSDAVGTIDPNVLS